MMMKKKIRLLFLVFILLIIIATAYINQLVVQDASGKIFSDTDHIPYNSVGLLLGTSKFSKKGGIDSFYTYRINACIRLFKAKKIYFVIVSGDAHDSRGMDQARQMKSDLILGGIDSTRIVMDNQGDRTILSMYRLKSIFKQRKVTIISQEFHNQRALYMARYLGIQAIAYNAQDVSGFRGFLVLVREKLARVRMFLDFLIHKGVYKKY